MHLDLASLGSLVGALAVTAAALAVPPGHAVHERRGAPHPRINQRMAADVVLPMRVGLKQNAAALDAAEKWLMEVSDPRSARYGQHWSSERVIETFRPSHETVDAVAQWLGEAGIPRERITHAANKAWLAFDATVAEAERLLHTEYLHDGVAEDRRGSVVACNEYHLPMHIQQHVDYVTPGVKGTMMDLRPPGARLNKRARPAGKMRPHELKFKPMPLRTDAASANDSLANCDQAITPACIRALYNFDAPSPDARVSPDNTLGIFEEGDFYAQEDFDSFFAAYTDIPNGTAPILDSIDGGQAPVDVSMAGGESNLDFQLAYPIIYPQQTTLYQTDDNFYATGSNATQNGLFNTFLDAIDGSYCTSSAFGETGNDATRDPVYPNSQDPNGFQGALMCGVYKPTNVISISYGEFEADLPAAYQMRQCNEYLKLGLQGVSVLVASGDTGVGGFPNGSTGNGPRFGCLRDDDVFSPSQPNGCPWLTNVGATKVYEGTTVRDPESAAFDPGSRANFSSGGGFSNVFSVPSYQQAAVDAYFRDHDPPYPHYQNGDYANALDGGRYNRNGRGIPDVAANGDNTAVVVRGKFGTSGGTSASCPIFAALVNRIVEERLANGKGPLGFINPVLYQNPQVLHDVRNGSNPGCGTDGFRAVEGWDPVTGLGTPDYPKMRDLFLSLP